MVGLHWWTCCLLVGLLFLHLRHHPAKPEDQETFLPRRNVPRWVLYRNGHVWLHQESPGLLWELWSRYCHDFSLFDLHNLLLKGDQIFLNKKHHAEIPPGFSQANRATGKSG